jgi:regulator of sigma E protease
MDIPHILLIAFEMMVMICVLVAAHEYGHYLFARLFGMGVEEFAIGFGKKPIWTWMRKTYSVEEAPGPAGHSAGVNLEPSSFNYPTDGSGALQPEPVLSPAPAQVKLSATETTDFTIRPWPLGGFVRIKGMIPEEDGSEVNVPGGFYSKAPWKRFVVLLAGPVFSVLAGIIIIIGALWIWGKEMPSHEPVLGEMKSDSVAYLAGLRPGDRIITVDGKSVKTFYDITANIADKGGKKVAFRFEREGQVKDTTVIPKTKELPVILPNMEFSTDSRKAGRLEVQFDTYRVKVSFAEALKEGMAIPGRVVSQLVGLISKPALLKESVGGPGSIAMATSQASEGGIQELIILAAGLSISVGIFNLLPIPPLDGGQMLVAFAEMLRGGRRLSIKVQGAVTAVGLALVAMLFVSVILIDVGRIKKSGEDTSKVIEKKDK